MTPLEQMQSERLELLSHIDTLNQDARYLRLQIDLNASQSDIKSAYTAKLNRVIRASNHAVQSLRSLNEQIKFENMRLDALRTKNQKAA